MLTPKWWNSTARAEVGSIPGWLTWLAVLGLYGWLTYLVLTAHRAYPMGDEDARELYVQFRRGRTYVYFDVPPTAYAALLEAPSKGRYVNFEIKPYHRYRRL